MFVYRVIPRNNTEYINEIWEGINTFDYSKPISYIHFFLLPEFAEALQEMKDLVGDPPTDVLKFDIPYSILKDNFGVGMYKVSKWYPRIVRIPLLECRIEYKIFKKEWLVDREPHILDSWKNKEILDRYILHCAYNKECIKYFNSDTLEVALNTHFNFLDYFPISELIKEGLDISHYPHPIDLNNITIKDLNIYRYILYKYKEYVNRKKEEQKNPKKTLK